MKPTITYYMVTKKDYLQSINVDSTSSVNSPIPALLLAATDTVYDVPLFSPVSTYSITLASCDPIVKPSLLPVG